MKLFIAEKPSVGRAIAQALGTVNTKNQGYIECENDSVVTWAYGHMYAAAEPDYYTAPDIPVLKNGNKVWRLEDLPIIPAKFARIEKPSCRDQIRVIGKLLARADTVINAGDPDREGQLLIDEMLEELHWSGKTLRYWANAVDEKTVKTALNDLKDNENYTGLRNSATGRGQADWIIGMNLSRAYTLLNRKTTIVGRVKTPTLKIVADRDEQIANFKPRDYYTVTGRFSNNMIEYAGVYLPADTDPGIDEEGRIADKIFAEKVKNAVLKESGRIESVKIEHKKVKQPAGFSLSDLTAACSERLGLTAKETLEIAQSLYENKYTSYPRTDCEFLPTSQIEDAPEVISAIARIRDNLTGLCARADTGIRSGIWNDEKTTAHHAIVPVANAAGKPLTGKEGDVYELIARRYLAQFYPEHEYAAQEIVTEIKGRRFVTKIKAVTAPAWKEVYAEEEETAPAELINAEQGDIETCVAAEIKAAKTKPPAKFTEGTLIKAMENIYKYAEKPEDRQMLKDGDGIGTSATRAGIIEELKVKGYLTRKGKNIITTEAGKELLKTVPAAIQSPVLTAVNERGLKEVEENRATVSEFLSGCVQFVTDEIAGIKERIANQPKKERRDTGLLCPFCGKKIQETEKSYLCEAWRYNDPSSCKMVIGKDFHGAYITAEILEKIVSGQKPILDFASKAGKPFRSALVADPKKGIVFEFLAPSDFKCPSCGRPLRRLESKKRPGTFFYACTGYRDEKNPCGEMYGETDGKPDFKITFKKK